MAKEKAAIRNSGMGGFLNPPTHPEHEYSVSTYYSNGKENGSMSLSYAANCDYISEDVRNRAKSLLDSWEKPALESEEIQDWIHQVMGYFKHCYVGKDKSGNESWNASDLFIDNTVGLNAKERSAKAVANQDKHAGVHFIRKYYPEFILEENHVDNAYWGSKK